MFLNLGFSHQASLPSPSTTWRWPTTLATWSSTAPPTTRKWAFHLLHLQLHLLFCSHLRWLYSLRRAIRHKLCWDQQIWAALWLAYLCFQNYLWGQLKSLVYHFVPAFCELFLSLGVTCPANLTDLLSRNLGKKCDCHRLTHSHGCFAFLLLLSMISFSNSELESTWRTLLPLRLASLLPLEAPEATGTFSEIKFAGYVLRMINLMHHQHRKWCWQPITYKVLILTQQMSFQPLLCFVFLLCI